MLGGEAVELFPQEGSAIAATKAIEIETMGSGGLRARVRASAAAAGL
jgi:hypothetical protein